MNNPKYRAVHKGTIKGYTNLARFLSNVSETLIEVPKEQVSGLPESRYAYSPDVVIETTNDGTRFTRIESAHAVYQIYMIAENELVVIHA